jgi:BirA family transcriptional regulator, biotin operon repressor / biotin---[acetyl-CoA-carboxylase] ligase
VSRLIGAAVHALDTVDSTQRELARLAAEGAPEGTVVMARHQTAGRGRRGRHWWDAPGESLLVSVLLRPALPTAQVPQLSLVAGVAVADALEAAAGIAARIRWPNDVLVGGRKICGILADAVSTLDGRVDHVLLGIGINIDQTEFPEDLRARATSLRLATGATPNRGRLFAGLLGALDFRYGEWLAGGFAPLRVEWRRRASMLGDKVRTPDGAEGIAVDVAEDGALLVDAGTGGLRRIVAGALADS